MDQILSSLPNGRPFQLLAQAVLFVEAQVAALQAQNFETSFRSDVINASHLIIDNLTPGTKHVRIEVSFVPDSGDAPTTSGSFIMYTLVSPETDAGVNFISTNSPGTIVAGASALSLPIASITGVADLQAVTGTNVGTVGFAVKELSATAGTYFVKVSQ